MHSGHGSERAASFHVPLAFTACRHAAVICPITTFCGVVSTRLTSPDADAPGSAAMDVSAGEGVAGAGGAGAAPPGAAGVLSAPWR